jgi:hypothetical protein
MPRNSSTDAWLGCAAVPAITARAVSAGNTAVTSPKRSQVHGPVDTVGNTVVQV